MKALKKLLTTTLKLVILVALVAGGYYGYQQYTAEAADEELGELPTVVAEIRDITVAVSATGILQPVKIVEIKSKASGEILEMPVENGDFLRAGDLIAQVDTRIIDQEIKQVEADFESAQIRLDIARKQHERAESLHAQDLISANDLETSEQNFTNAESAFIRAQASLELARERLADATVRAPISGTVISKSVEQGQIIASSTNNVSGGTVLLQMADLSELEIRTLVDEIDIGSVSTGMRVESTVEAFADLAFEGQVMKIEPQAVVQQSVTTFPVLSRIDNREGLLLPGMNADVSIIIHQRSNVLTVANEAVRSPEDAREVVAMLNLGAFAAIPRPVPAAVRMPDAALAAGQMESEPPADNGATGNGDNGHDGNGNSDNGHSNIGRSDNGHGDNGYGDNRGGDSGVTGSGHATPELVDKSWGTDGTRRQAAVVFALGANGEIVPREIVTGVRDWEVSEVLSGLEPGDELVLLPSTSLLRSQRSMRERYARRNAVVPGGGR